MLFSLIVVYKLRCLGSNRTYHDNIAYRKVSSNHHCPSFKKDLKFERLISLSTKINYFHGLKLCFIYLFSFCRVQHFGTITSEFCELCCRTILKSPLNYLSINLQTFLNQKNFQAINPWYKDAEDGISGDGPLSCSYVRHFFYIIDRHI